MTARQRVQVWSDRKMVTLQGEVLPAPEEPTLLSGVADGRDATITAVKLDDGRELLIATRDLEDAAPDTERKPFVCSESDAVAS